MSEPAQTDRGEGQTIGWSQPAFWTDLNLAPFACSPEHSLGRLVAQPDSADRSPFSRDRDRIIHSAAFRRLKYKTQVFIYDEGDEFRTRLTHSLEVAQIARSLAKQLEVDEDLAEAIALAHDLGHSPFGHCGEDALTDALEKRGFAAYDHNLQSLRIVASLERKYARFDGLNLTYETIEGLAKHNGPVAANKRPNIEAVFPDWDLKLDTYAGLEAQIAALADDIAYNSHDVDDGLRAGYIHFRDVEQLELPARILAKIDGEFPNLDPVRRRFELSRGLVNAFCGDVLAQTRANLQRLQGHDVEAVRNAGHTIVTFSPSMQDALNELRSFLFNKLYRHHAIMRRRTKMTKIVRDLFDFFDANPETLPPDWSNPDMLDDPHVRAGLITDYIADMTDRFAIKEHARLFDLYAV